MPAGFSGGGASAFQGWNLYRHLHEPRLLALTRRNFTPGMWKAYHQNTLVGGNVLKPRRRADLIG